MTLPFRYLILGQGAAKVCQVGNKGALLDQAYQAGLPVPFGLILLEETLLAALNAKLITDSSTETSILDISQLMTWLALPQFPGKVAVRSAFAAEDGNVSSLAGYFTSRLFINPNDPQEFSAALSEVWTSAHRQPEKFRRDVLIMSMVDAQIAGVAFTETEFADDLINFTTGTADSLVSGTVAGSTLLIAKLLAWEQADIDLPAWAQRLQRLLKNIRQVFGWRNWDIEWADDGEKCWLIQIRPITRPSRRNEIFTIANHKEILPDLPSQFMTSLIAACAHDLFAYYREFDDSLPAQRPFIEIFFGRPLINLSLLHEMMRTWGLPTRLVTESIGGVTDREYDLNIPRLISKFPVLIKMAWAQLNSVKASQHTITEILKIGQSNMTTMTDCISALRAIYTKLVKEMFSLTASMSGPVAILRRLGVLAEHNVRQQTISTQMFGDLTPLKQLVDQHSEMQNALKAGNLPAESNFQLIWQQYLAKHGHRGIYESDIARPRWHEEPQPLMLNILSHHKSSNEIAPRSLLGIITLPLWLRASKPMLAREQLRYNAMKAFDKVRQNILKLAKTYQTQGQLPEVKAIWQLTITEAENLATGWIPTSDFWRERTTEIAQLSKVNLPDMIHRFDDLTDFNEGLSDSHQHFKGISLTTGTVTGKAWVLSEPQTSLPPEFTPSTTILVARAIDAGWIPTFACVAGVVVETGGDLSHGSIILREIGLPAITNVRQATRYIQTGDQIIVKANTGNIEKL